MTLPYHFSHTANGGVSFYRAVSMPLFNFKGGGRSTHFFYMCTTSSKQIEEKLKTIHNHFSRHLRTFGMAGLSGDAENAKRGDGQRTPHTISEIKWH